MMSVDSDQIGRFGRLGRPPLDPHYVQGSPQDRSRFGALEGRAEQGSSGSVRQLVESVAVGLIERRGEADLASGEWLGFERGGSSGSSRRASGLPAARRRIRFSASGDMWSRFRSNSDAASVEIGSSRIAGARSSINESRVATTKLNPSALDTAGDEVDDIPGRGV